MANLETICIFIIITIAIIIILVIIFSLSEGYNDYVIDLPETDYYNFNCNSSNIRFRTKDFLSNMTKQEILNSGGTQTDINNMDLQLEDIVAGYSTKCHVTYSFKTPENGELANSNSSRITKTKIIFYQTIQSNVSYPYGWGGYYNWPMHHRWGRWPYRYGYSYPGTFYSSNRL